MEVSLLLCTFLAAGSKSRGNNDVLRRSHQLQYKISWYDVMLVFRGRESVGVDKRASLLTDSYVSWPGEDFFSLQSSCTRQ